MYEIPTEHGVLKTNRKYNERKASGQVGMITFNVQYNQHEMKLICNKLNIDVMDKHDIENAVLKAVTGTERVIVPSPQATPKADNLAEHKAVIKQAIDNGGVTAENFEQRLTAYADTSKLSKEDTEQLRQAFPLSKPKANEIVF